MAVTLNPLTLHRRRCRAVRAELSDYLDGDLEAASAAKVRRHARWCPSCRRVLANLRRTLTGLEALRGTEPPGYGSSAK